MFVTPLICLNLLLEFVAIALCKKKRLLLVGRLLANLPLLGTLFLVEEDMER